MLIILINWEMHRIAIEHLGLISGPDYYGIGRTLHLQGSMY